MRHLGFTVLILSLASNALAAPVGEPVAEGELPAAASGGAARLPASTMPMGVWAIQAAAGSEISGKRSLSATQSDLTLRLDIRLGLTERLQLTQLGLAYRFGEPGDVELVTDLESDGFATNARGAFFPFEFGTAARFYFSPSSSLLLGARASSVLGSENLVNWTWSAHGGWIVRVGERLTLTAGVGLVDDWDVSETPYFWRSTGARLALGSVMTIATRPLPLVSVEVLDGFFLDGYSMAKLDFNSTEITVMGGCTIQL
ncbi:hypothetical protein [Vulgatibacter incomptus]|uniref:Uncharacterized protein n=1 Tax=Vulgatibacter incomptus TaxID=1391653 RepID=A0A0K1PD12_9BACT|nr:hypothetical protein [Vulgatibacter incomptus]AKU91392.1 hypothetical protein AKJ08_1779 [Vulgatibacter incomptus]